MGSEGYYLTVEIENNKNVEIRTSGGAVCEKTSIDLDFTKRMVIELFEELMRENQIRKRRELEVLGTILYQAIFNGEVGVFFKSKLTEFSQKNRIDSKPFSINRMRVELVFRQDALDLANLPWEFLYYPDLEGERGFFLASKTNLILSRHIPSPIDRINFRTPEEDTLRILIVESQPEDFGTRNQSDYDKIIPEIQKLIEKTSKSGARSIELEVLTKPTLDDFIFKLDDFKPHIMHYIGHGKYDKKEKGSIALLSEDGKNAVWLSSKNFADYFENFQPRLVFLHLCQGSPNNLDANFAELAPELIKMNIQAVVAMRYPIKPEVALKFNETFYKSLLSGITIATAVQEGRHRIFQAGENATIGSPVLFMQSFDGPIFPEAAADKDKTNFRFDTTGGMRSSGTMPAMERSAQSYSFAMLSKAANEEVDNRNYKASKVNARIEQLRSEVQGKDIETTKQIIIKCLQREVYENPESEMITVFQAMLNEINSLSAPKNIIY